MSIQKPPQHGQENAIQAIIVQMGQYLNNKLSVQLEHIDH